MSDLNINRSKHINSFTGTLAQIKENKKAHLVKGTTFAGRHYTAIALGMIAVIAIPTFLILRRQEAVPIDQNQHFEPEHTEIPQKVLVNITDLSPFQKDLPMNVNKTHIFPSKIELLPNHLICQQNQSVPMIPESLLPPSVMPPMPEETPKIENAVPDSPPPPQPEQCDAEKRDEKRQPEETPKIENVVPDNQPPQPEQITTKKACEPNIEASSGWRIQGEELKIEGTGPANIKTSSNGIQIETPGAMKMEVGNKPVSCRWEKNTMICT